ncbi:hypothetical protein NYQ83_04370 [Afifella sp. JA880]|uniref:SPW repeat domain-containing protein n=1 Tax=Afifella sp. JA880 TaxID=2975280 RepID=UPI0021BA4CE5|nr:hypothetical protein [Afifella sp. JA880]MCT8266498.1 hypothetical protein [Afifella sp. JA880]
MRFLPTLIHGVLDYLVGALLIAVPYFVGFDVTGEDAARVAEGVPMVIGGVTIIYSLGTIYELGLLRHLPMRIHLWFDGVGGALLASSPFLFGFASEVWVPHVAVGLFEIVAALVTKTTPSKSARKWD